MKLEDRIKHLEALYASLPCALLHFNVEAPHRVLLANQEACAVLGYAAVEECIGIDLFTNIHPEYYAYVYDVIQQTCAGNKSSFELKIVRQHGSMAWISGAITLSADADGQAILQCVFEETTEEKKCRMAEENERQRYKLAMGMSQDVVFEYDIDTNVFRYYKNMLQEDGSQKLTTVEVENFISRLRSDDMVHPDDIDNVQSILCAGKKCDGNQRLRLADDPEGVYHWFYLRGTRVCEGQNLVRVIGTMRDIDEQKILTDIVNLFVYNNCDYFIFLDGLNDSYIMYGKGSSNTPLPPLRSTHYTLEMESYNQIYVVEEDRERVTEAMRLDNVISTLDRDGQLLVYVGVMEPEKGYTRKRIQFIYYDKAQKQILLSRTDVSHMYQEEERKNALLREALEVATQASRAKTEFLSRISHDIRTPLNTIVGMTAIAEIRMDKSDQVQNCLSKINTAAQYLLSLINSILDMSSIESGKMLLTESKFEFESFLHDISAAIYPQARNLGLAFHMRVQEPLEKYYVADALHITQVLMNLLSNSLKFTKPGGLVEMSISEKQRLGDRSMISFTVRDTGVGISPEFIKKVFEPFEQENSDYARNQTGSGLGLPLAQNFVELMGGSITVESQCGHGTCITVAVPLSLSMEPHSDCIKIPEFQDYRALIVSCDAPHVQQCTATLKEIGLRVDTVDCGPEAAIAVNKAQAEQDGYRFVIVDLKLGTIDGLECTRRLRQTYSADGMTVFLSAYDWESVAEEAHAVGVDHFLFKPVLRFSVHDALLRLLKPAPLPCTAQSQCRFNGQHVLLVEDNEINQEIAKMLLEEEGLLVDTADNGQQALDLFIQKPVGHYTLILMDIRMPVLDGLTATTRIRLCDRPDATTVPIIAMTANAFQEDMETAFKAGMNNYLTKPVNPEKLYQTIERAVAHGWI